MNEQTEAPTPYERLRYHYGIPDDLIAAYRTAILGEQAALVEQLTEAAQLVVGWFKEQPLIPDCAFVLEEVLAAADAQKSADARREE